MKPACALAVVLTLPLLGGCYASYTVDAENHTPQPVVIEMLARAPESDLLASIAQPLRLGPGDKGGIAPVQLDTVRPVLLRVDSAVKPGQPVTLDVRPGWTVVEITQDGVGTTGPLHVRQVQR